MNIFENIPDNAEGRAYKAIFILMRCQYDIDTAGKFVKQVEELAKPFFDKYDFVKPTDMWSFFLNY